MGIKDKYNPVLYSYIIRMCQCISYLTGPQCPLDIYCLSEPQCRMCCLCVCANVQLGLQKFNSIILR